MRTLSLGGAYALAIPGAVFLLIAAAFLLPAWVLYGRAHALPQAAS